MSGQHTSTPPQSLRDALLQALAFEPQGEAAGNVTAGKGTLDGKPVRVALVENRAASGSIGVQEGERLESLFQVARAERAPVVLFLDSAGARVSQGLKALGAFRSLYRAGLEAALARTPIAAVLGKNCFGGSSMLAHLAQSRLFGPTSQLAMSGPAVIASASGLDPLDEMFRAMAEATMSAGARAKVSPANSVWAPEADLTAWLREATTPHGDMASRFRARHVELGSRLSKLPEPRWEDVRRRDLDKLYDGGCAIRETDGILEGRGTRDGAEERVLGLVGKSALTGARAWRFADIAWSHLDAAPARLEVFLDCASHAAKLDEEKLILTEYVVDMGLALAALAARGTSVGLTVVGKAGGGVYVALAAPAARVASLYGADIQVLPGSAVAAILGESQESAPSFDEYRNAGVADQEIKLGFAPGKA